MRKKRKQRNLRLGSGHMGSGHVGSSIDDFLKEEGIFEEAQAQAMKEVMAWQLDEAMKKQDGDAAEDQPDASGPVAESEE